MDHPEAVRAELDADPLGRGYAGMSDSQASTDLNTIYRETWVRAEVSEILEAISAGALSGLDAGERANVDTVLSMGDSIEFGPGSRARVMLTTAFSGVPATLNALDDVGKRTISRATELRCLVTSAIVAAARALE